MKKVRKTRGIAIELALVTMLTIYGLSMILLTVVELMAVSNKNMTASLDQRVETRQIAYDFVSDPENYNYGGDEYNVEVNDQRDQLRVKNKDGKIVLYIELDSNGNVARWTNHDGDLP